MFTFRQKHYPPAVEDAIRSACNHVELNGLNDADERTCSDCHRPVSKIVADYRAVRDYLTEPLGPTAAPIDADLMMDALRFARDNFADENGLPWSDDEYSRLQAWIDQLEPQTDVHRTEGPTT